MAFGCQSFIGILCLCLFSKNVSDMSLPALVASWPALGIVSVRIIVSVRQKENQQTEGHKKIQEIKEYEILKIKFDNHLPF